MKIRTAPRPSFALASLGAALALTLAACAGDPTPPPRPVAPPPVESLGTATMARGQLVLDTRQKPASGSLLLVQDAGAWPKATVANERQAPITAAVSIDTKGTAWVAHDRPGSTLEGGKVYGALPPSSRYPRRPVSLARLSLEGLALETPWEGLDGDQVALVRLDQPGPLVTRVISAADYGDQRWTVTPRGQQDLPLLAVRVNSLAAPLRQASLSVKLEAGSCDEAHTEAARQGLTQALERVGGAGAVKLDGSQADAQLTATPEGCDPQQSRVLVKNSPSVALIRTPFWTPEALSVPQSTPEVAAALMMAARGEVARALALLGSQHDDPTVRLIQAALALSVGWSTDAVGLLGQDAALANSLEGRLLLAGAAYRLGDYHQARALLEVIAPKAQALTTSPPELWARVAMARAAIALAFNEPRQAIAHMEEGIKAAQGTTHVTTLALGLAEVHMTRNDLQAVILALSNITGAGGLSVEQRGTMQRYQAMLKRISGDPAACMSHYEKAAAIFEESRNWRAAATMWRLQAEVAQEDDPTRTKAALGRAHAAAARSFDADTWNDVRQLELQDLAIQSAQQGESPKDAEARVEEAVEAARRAERYDLAATAHRYGLLLLPGQASITVKIDAVKAALEDAMASSDPVERAIIFNLLGQLEAGRFRFEQAEEALQLALAFANSARDNELAAMIKVELDAMKKK